MIKIKAVFTSSVFDAKAGVAIEGKQSKLKCLISLKH